ncbi:MAG TPA: hypothetical protein VN704_03515 [Verrucomicrobiae bacterium]|nr:hypothetical protein [Verrucomicrobiae bacterium]
MRSIRRRYLWGKNNAKRSNQGWTTKQVEDYKQMVPRKILVNILIFGRQNGFKKRHNKYLWISKSNGKVSL